MPCLLWVSHMECVVGELWGVCYGWGMGFVVGELWGVRCACCQITHWGWNQMDAVSQTTVSNEFSWMKMYEFRLRFNWNFFLRVQSTIFQHWFGWWLGAVQVNQWWLAYWCIYTSLSLNELRVCSMSCLHWLFVRAIHLSQVDSPHKGPVMQTFDYAFVLSMNVRNCWKNGEIAVILRPHDHDDGHVTVMIGQFYKETVCISLSPKDLPISSHWSTLQPQPARYATWPTHRFLHFTPN